MTKKKSKKEDSNMANENTHEITDQIGATAGKVWNVLASDGSLSISKLIKQVGGPRDLAMQSIGWLARENKIQIVEQKRVKTVSLVPEEACKVA